MTALASRPVPVTSVQVQCPRCKATLRVGEQARSKLIECPRCGHQCFLNDGSLGRDVDAAMFSDLVDEELAAGVFVEEEPVREAQPEPSAMAEFVKKYFGVLVLVSTATVGIVVTAVMLLVS